MWRRSLAQRQTQAIRRSPPTDNGAVMSFSRLRRWAGPLALVGSLTIAAGTMAAPRQAGELTQHGLASHPKWFAEQQPLFGSYLASGDGEGSGALAGRIVWDIYEDQSLRERHQTFFHGYLEREGRRYRFEIVGIYTPESTDRRKWKFAGA